MRRTANDGDAGSSPASSSSHSNSSPRRARKRARHTDASWAPPARSVGQWRESRGANGQVVISIDSDDEENSSGDMDAPAKQKSDEESDFEVRPSAFARAAPTVYSVDSDSDSDFDEGVCAKNTDQKKKETTTQHDQIMTKQEVVEVGSDDDDDEEEEEEEEDEEDEEEEVEEVNDADESEAEWQPDDQQGQSDGEQKKDNVDSGDNINGNDDDNDDGDDSTDFVMERVPSRPSPPPPVTNPDIVPVKQETTPVKSEQPPRDNDDGDSEELSLLAQHSFESPPARTRHHRHHPSRTVRRSVVRRRRLDEDRAGILLFNGRQYDPPASVVKHMIECIARSVGPMTSHDRQWVDFLLLSKFNSAVARLSEDVSSRFPDWMKIALGAADDDNGPPMHHVQREPLLPRPICYTLRPSQLVTPKASSSSSRPKTKQTIVVGKQKRVVDVKFLEKRAEEFQATGRRSSSKAKHQPPRRRASVVGTPDSSYSFSHLPPFSPASSTSTHQSVRGDVSSPATKRQRVSPTSNGIFSPSTASAATATRAIAPPAYRNLAAVEKTSGTNRSMPCEWQRDSSTRSSFAGVPPVAMNPLFTMSLEELKAHIHSVHLDGRVRSFEKPMEILQRLMSHPRNRHGTFNSPVNPVALNLPTYFDVIKKPMDLGTIKMKLEEGDYVEQDDFIEDVRLVFENAMAFNPSNHSVHVDANFLMHHFDDLLQGDTHDRQLKRRLQHQPTERHACLVCLGNTCAMCEQGCLAFAQPHLQCAASCGADLRKGSVYFATRDGTRVWCAKCRVRHVKTTSDRSPTPSQDNGHDYNGGHAVGDPMHRGSGSTDSKKKKKKHQRNGGGRPPSLQDTIDTIDLHGELVKKKVEMDAEPWVKCTRCCRWLHQVCGLYNPVYGAHTVDHEYVCPLCVRKQRFPTKPRDAATTTNAVENTSPKQGYDSSCHQIPTCELSVFIEAFLRRELRQIDQPQAADELHVRVLSFPHERVHVPEGVVNTFDQNATILEQTYPDADHTTRRNRFSHEIPFTSRGIFLFQRHEGADVCLFTVFVQEFGDDCGHEANRRSVYVAYLDSIRYLKPPSARTASYHFIMMAYFDYIRRHGFERVHIWSCPPQKRISYVFWCRPPFQKTPSAEHLRSWYGRLLSTAKNANIVKSWTNMYDRYFSTIDHSQSARLASESGVAGKVENGNGVSSVSTRGAASRSQVVDPKDHVWPTAQLPPLFDGDFILAELERILGRLSARNAKYRRGSSSTSTGTGKSSAIGSSGGKLAVGEFVARIKEEVTEKSTTTSTTPRPPLVQVDVNLREVFERCQQAVQRLKNDLLVVDLVVVAPPQEQHTVACQPHLMVPSWWHTVPRFFGSRFMFHQLCATATYQFDSLRRAKHSTMMMLHHFCNENVRQLNVFCTECCLLITHADYWSCPTCEKFALCDMCHHRDGSSHVHALEFGSRVCPPKSMT